MTEAMIGDKERDATRHSDGHDGDGVVLVRVQTCTYCANERTVKVERTTALTQG
jgi:hypothetical protein